jgi:hypothetical protein
MVAVLEHAATATSAAASATTRRRATRPSLPADQELHPASPALIDVSYSDNCFRKGLRVCLGDIVATLAPITGTAEDLQIGHGIPAALAPWDDVIEMRFYGRTAHAQIPVARDTRHALALSPVPRRHSDLYGLRDGLPPARFLDGLRDGLPLASFLDGLPPASFLGGLRDGLRLRASSAAAHLERHRSSRAGS